MKTWRLLTLAAVVVVLGSYIFFYERHRPSRDERLHEESKVLAGVERDDITAIDLSNSHGDLRLEQRGDSWRLVAPIDFAADDTAVGGLLTALLNLEAERRLAPGEVDPAEHGLDKPAMTVALTTSDGTTHRIAVGNETALGSNRAISLGDGGVVICSGWFVSDLDRDPESWRSRDVVEVFASDVASIEITSPEDRVHLARQEQQWQLLEPIQDLADREHARNLVANLNALEVEEFIDSAEVDASTLGLDPPRYRVTIVPSSGADPVVLELGATREVAGATQVACRRNGTELLWINDRAEASLGMAPVRWRSQVLYPFDSWDVQAVSFTAGDTTVALTHDGGVWTTAGGDPAEGGIVLDRLSLLSRLTAIALDLVDPGRPERGRIELTLSSADDSARQVVFTFAEPLQEGGAALARVSERDTLMSVAAGEVEELLGDLEVLTQPLVVDPLPDAEEEAP